MPPDTESIGNRADREGEAGSVRDAAAEHVVEFGAPLCPPLATIALREQQTGGPQQKAACERQERRAMGCHAFSIAGMNLSSSGYRLRAAARVAFPSEVTL